MTKETLETANVTEDCRDGEVVGLSSPHLQSALLLVGQPKKQKQKTRKKK